MIAFLVEDSKKIRESLIALINSMTEIVIADFAETQNDAIEWLENNPWDVVIVDLNLREGHGLEVLRALQTNSKVDLSAKRRVVLTNYASPQMRIRCEELGADAFFDKSSDIDRLIEYLTGEPA
ncbi:response regulator [Ampullimonas aquatilis]|uniref:response regulator n=1 Tax=Ampullimonas aquatilis TaxID=1341549 RepID=UPI003C7661E7